MINNVEDIVVFLGLKVIHPKYSIFKNINFNVLSSQRFKGYRGESDITIYFVLRPEDHLKLRLWSWK